MTIASHHQSDTWSPQCAWPEYCRVQWGNSGVVYGSESNYVTAYFKAFPKSGSGSFIRGEGKTLEEAERKAFIQYNAEDSCDHRYGRGYYRCGAGKCLKCDALKTDAFKPIVKLGEHRMPLTVADLYWFASGSGYVSAKPDDSRHERWRRRRLLRARHFGLEIPDPPADASF